MTLGKNDEYCKDLFREVKMKKFYRWKRGETVIAKCLSCGQKTMIVRKTFTERMTFVCGCGFKAYGMFADMKSVREWWSLGA